MIKAIIFDLGGTLIQVEKKVGLMFLVVHAHKNMNIRVREKVVCDKMMERINHNKITIVRIV